MRFLREKAVEEEYCKPAEAEGSKAQVMEGQGCSGNALIFVGFSTIL